MSADNGVYILVTPILTPRDEGRKEYRPSYMQAVENYLWDAESGEETENPDIHIENARQMWKYARVVFDRTKALKMADKMAQECAVLEYGIQFIEIPREF